MGFLCSDYNFEMGRKQPRNAGEYRVRDILDFKEEDGQEYLLIWWQGYPKREATWEPKENIEHILDFNEGYRRLKLGYQQRQQASKQHFEEPEPPHSNKANPPSNPIKNKPIAKEHRGKKGPDDVYHSDSEPEEPEGAIGELAQAVEENTAPKTAQLSIQDQSIRENEHSANPSNQAAKAELKRMIKLARPVQFQIKIKEFKELPLVRQELNAIKQAFIRDGKRMYEIELESEAFSGPIVVHENYVRVLWPRKLAEYLLSKIK